MTQGSSESDAMSLDAVKRCTFRIKYRNSTEKTSFGTAFVIERGGQYLVTVEHVVRGIVPRGAIDIFREGRWGGETFSLVGTGPARRDGRGCVDVAVLKLQSRLPVAEPVPASSDGLTAGQAVHILGFPSEDGGATEMTVAAGAFRGFEDDDLLMRIEAVVSQGFSGGPVVFVPEGQPPEALRIAGILCEKPRRATEPPTAYAYDIRRAIELID